ncbi:MAG TPA: Gfo/Idh/MocA family oxidoreductase [Polyangiaceae bacterium]|nr:Gfo/Idh/MocA family oxidoreductase [Polyangiaceae bacterium]
MRTPLGWGVIGTGSIAAAFTEAVASSTRARIVSVAGSSPEKGRAFARHWSVPHAATSVAELVRHEAVEAVYVASPHPRHEEHALAAIGAGKAVLCEKPLATSSDSAERIVRAAKSAGVFLMEAYMYRCHPLLEHALTLLRSGAIGRIEHVRAHFGFRVERNLDGRLFNPNLGGGAILDVGGYPVSFARLIAGLAEDAAFAEPVELSAQGRLGPSGVDELAVALLRFPSGVTAELGCATRHELGTAAAVFGDRGWLELPNPWIPRGARLGLESDLIVHRDGHDPEHVVVTTGLPTYAIEAELVAETLPALDPRPPAMSSADTLGNMRVMEAWSRALRSV